MSRATDEELIEQANREERVIITADLDFPRHLALRGAAGPGIVLFRGGTYSEPQARELMGRVLERVSAEQVERSIVVVDQTRIRRTPLPLDTGS